MIPKEERIVPIPEGVEVTVENNEVTVKGRKGELKRDFSSIPVIIRKSGNMVIVETSCRRREERGMVGTVGAHINNMIKGVDKGFVYKLKVIFAHFPISVKVKGKEVLIENFCGERGVRRAKIVGNAEVSVKGDDVIVRGINVEEVAQTAANIEAATKVKKKDPRVFLDGIYLYEKECGD